MAGGCSLKRPDMYFRFADRYLQLEIDENGHRRQSCDNEDTRLEIIAADAGVPGLVIRINPDFDDCFGPKRKLSNQESVVVVRNSEAYNSLISSVVAAIEAFFQEPVATVRTVGFPAAWWASRDR